MTTAAEMSWDDIKALFRETLVVTFENITMVDVLNDLLIDNCAVFV